MSLAIVSAALALVGLVMYGIRTGQLWPDAGTWDRLSRITGALTWIVLVGFFWDVSRNGGDLVGRQLLLSVSTAAFTSTQVGGVLGRRHHRRREYPQDRD